MKALLLLSALGLAVPALAAPIPSFTATPPSSAPMPLAAERAGFWSELYAATQRGVDEAIAKHGKALGYERNQYNEKDLRCMRWFIAWAITEDMRRRNPAYMPATFTDWMARQHQRACDDKDDDNQGLGAPTGRGWNTIRASVLGPSASKIELRPPTTAEVSALAAVLAARLAAAAQQGAATSLGLFISPCVLNPQAPFCAKEGT